MGLFEDALSGIGNVLGGIVGTVVGVSASVVAGALGITVTLAQAALDSGCTTYDEVREFVKNN